MPGGRTVNRGPMRPQKLWTLSQDRRCYGENSGIIGTVFGLIFSCTGCLTMVAALYNSLTLIGLLPPGRQRNSILESLLGVVAVTCGGAGHLIVGTLVVMRRSRCIDRRRRVVTVRSGWLGLLCRRRSLGDFVSVSVQRARNRTAYGFDRPLYDVVLVDRDGSILTVGTVTQSEKLARQFAAEIGEFVGLPVQPVSI